MKYTVTVTQSETAQAPQNATQEIFRQSFDELDLGKLAIALNTKPRGRPARKSKEVQP